jgi:hypothetical protein
MKAKHPGVKILRTFIVFTDDGDMVNTVQVKHQVRIEFSQR